MAPEDLKASDVLHWQTTLWVDDAAAAQARAVKAGARRVSGEVVRLEGVPCEGREGALVRDADAHALLLLAR